MHNANDRIQHQAFWLPVIIAGLAGGIIEMAWVWTYSLFSTANPQEVARQITYTFLPAAGMNAVLFGVVIHLVLSIVLACAFAVALYGPFARRYGATGVFAAGLGTLATVWAVNFLVLLPALNPAFPTLMPYVVTFVSKLLFGAAMSAVLVSSSTGWSRAISIRRSAR